MALTFAFVPDRAADDEPRRAGTTPNCIRCGRFCHIRSSVFSYNGSITQNYVTFDCTGCGIFTESMW